MTVDLWGRGPRTHPAPYNPKLYAHLRDGAGAARRVLDPFAGTGRIFEMGWAAGVEVQGIDIEHWPDADSRVEWGNVLALPFADCYFDAIVTSPAYGNRMADHHQAKDASRRLTYAHALGRQLHPDNAGAMQWGPVYRDFHERAWAQCTRVLRPGGRMVLNCKDHIRGGHRVAVTDWHSETLRSLGYRELERVRVDTPSMRWGANREARVDYEWVIVLERRGQHPGGNDGA